MSRGGASTEAKGRTPETQTAARGEGDRHSVEGTMGVVGEIRLPAHAAGCGGHVVRNTTATVGTERNRLHHSFASDRSQGHRRMRARLFNALLHSSRPS